MMERQWTMASVSESAVTSHVNPRRLNQYIGALIVSLGGFSLGVTLGWNSSAADTLRNILNASGTQIGLIGGILNAGACGGIVTLPWLLKYFSRIGIMILTVPICLIGWSFICLADQQVWSLMIGRVLTGISGGVFCILTPIYISEIADKNTRVHLLTYFQLLINLGIFYAFLIAYILDERDGIWKYSLTCAVSCTPIAVINFLPESPVYHLRKGNLDSAIRSIKFYRGEAYKYDDELNEMKRLLEIKVPLLTMLKNRRVLRTVAICHIVIITQQLSGVNTLIFYATVIFNNGGSGDLTGSEQTLVVGVVQIVSCLICTGLIDFLGRRVLLTVSAALMGFSMILLGWYFSVRDDDPQLYDETYGWMPPVWITLYFAAFNIGLGPISWSILGDVFPSVIKTLGATYIVSLNWLLSLIGTLTFGELAESLTVSKTMWLFSGFSLLGSILCGAFVRETSGKSLADIQDEFHIDTIQRDNEGA